MNSVLSIFTLIVFAACAYWLFWGLPRHQTPPLASQSFTGRVKHVVDGDTFYLWGTRPSVRIWGIDTPESDEAGFQSSTDHLKRLALNKVIRCEIMQSSKSHGRIVARCYLPDGRDLGGQMIRDGMAREMRYFSKGYYSKRS